MDEELALERNLYPWLDSDCMADETVEPGAWDDEAELREMANTIRRLCAKLGQPVPPEVDSRDYEELDSILDELYSRLE